MCKQHQTTKVQQKEDNVGNHFATIWRRLLKLQLRIQKWANRTKPKRSAEWKQTRETIRQFMLIQSMNRNKLQQLWKTEQTNTEPPPLFLPHHSYKNKKEEEKRKGPIVIVRETHKTTHNHQNFAVTEFLMNLILSPYNIKL